MLGTMGAVTINEMSSLTMKKLKSDGSEEDCTATELAIYKAPGLARQHLMQYCQGEAYSAIEGLNWYSIAIEVVFGVFNTLLSRSDTEICWNKEIVFWIAFEKIRQSLQEQVKAGSQCDLFARSQWILCREQVKSCRIQVKAGS